jgi:hypothetical protein
VASRGDHTPSLAVFNHMRDPEVVDLATQTDLGSASGGPMTGQPIFTATDRIVAHCDGCSPAWSNTARSRNSGEYLLGPAMGSVLSRNEPSDKPGTLQIKR